MNKIQNSQLAEDDIPSRNASWKKIQPFALSFDVYKQWGTFEKYKEVAKKGVDLYQSKQELPRSMTDLRTCLFYEAKRWKHFEKNPSKKGLAYVHALVEAIRVRVHAKEIG